MKSRTADQNLLISGLLRELLASLSVSGALREHSVHAEVILNVNFESLNTSSGHLEEGVVRLDVDGVDVRLRLELRAADSGLLLGDDRDGRLPLKPSFVFCLLERPLLTTDSEAILFTTAASAISVYA